MPVKCPVNTVLVPLVADRSVVATPPVVGVIDQVPLTLPIKLLETSREIA